jgi:hypothetical protein
VTRAVEHLIRQDDMWVNTVTRIETARQRQQWHEVFIHTSKTHGGNPVMENSLSCSGSENKIGVMREQL